MGAYKNNVSRAAENLMETLREMEKGKGKIHINIKRYQIVDNITYRHYSTQNIYEPTIRCVEIGINSETEDRTDIGDFIEIGDKDQTSFPVQFPVNDLVFVATEGNSIRIMMLNEASNWFIEITFTIS